MRYFDQLNRELLLSGAPRRIVSLVPSISEYLWDLNLREELVGITKFCIKPAEMYDRIEKIGGTKSIHIDKIRTLQPDLIIANKEENTKEQIDVLSNEFPVWVSDVNTMNEALEMMRLLGELCNRKTEAIQLVQETENGLHTCKDLFAKNSCVYLMWNEPYMAAASNTFINSVLNYTGFVNVLQDRERYPVVALNEIKLLQPEYCLLSSEPFPFKDKHVNLLQHELKSCKVVLVDGEMFSWYGSHLLTLPLYLNKLKKEIG